MTMNKKNVLLASAAAGLMTLALTVASGVAHAEDAPAKVKCYGVNACKGQGDCGGKGHSCSGKNECKAQGFVYKPSAEECLAIKGGRLTPEAK